MQGGRGAEPQPRWRFLQGADGLKVVEKHAGKRWTCVKGGDGRTCTSKRSKREEDHGREDLAEAPREHDQRLAPRPWTKQELGAKFGHLRETAKSPPPKRKGRWDNLTGRRSVGTAESPPPKRARL